MIDVLEEHHGYLCDGPRLQRFERAISRAVKPGDSVADIGCGFGILGLMCLKAGASHVWGIDRTPAIEVAREAMARGGFADRYTCIHEASFEAELPQQVDVIICDHVGCFGFDYGIIKTMGDARRRFLKPGGKVIPGQFALHVAAAQSPACRKLANSWADPPIPVELRWLNDYSLNTKHRREFAADELASAPAELGTIDLRGDCPDHFSFSAELEIDRACDLDGLAGWFSCEIVDGVWMTNSPLDPEHVNRAQVLLPFASPLAVLAGDTVAVTVSAHHESGVTSWTARVARTGRSARQSTWASTILDPRDRVPAAERMPRPGRDRGER